MEQYPKIIESESTRHHTSKQPLSEPIKEVPSMYLGIDISMNQLDCYRCVDGKGYHHRFANSEEGQQALMNWLGADTYHVVMEATGVYWPGCALVLHEAGHQASVVNPAQVKLFAKSLLRRGKTDQMDAELLHLYGERMVPKAWLPTEEVYDTLKLLTREREDLVKQCTMVKNQRHAHTHRHRCPDTLLTLLDERLALLQKHIQQLDSMMEDLCQEHLPEAFASLRSIPGVGLITACVLLGECEGFTHATSPKQVTSFVGMNPAPNQSGSFRGHTPISKIGSPLVRKTLYLATLQAAQHSVFKAFYERLLAKGKPNKVARIAVARKLLVIAVTLVQKQLRFDPQFHDKTDLQRP